MRSKLWYLLLIAISSSFLLACSNSSLSYEERVIKESIQTTRDRLLDPDSMIIYSCNYHVGDDDEVNNGEPPMLVYLYIGARNRAGGISDLEVMVHYKDGKVESIADENDVEEDALQSDASKNLLFVQAAGTERWTAVSEEEIEKIMK